MKAVIVPASDKQKGCVSLGQYREPEHIIHPIEYCLIAEIIVITLAEKQ